MPVASKITRGWAKIKFLYKTPSGMDLTASYETTGYEVSNMLNRLETNYWLSPSTDTQYIVDSGTAGTYVSVNYIALYDHNLYFAGATLTLQYSTDDFVADVNDAFTGEIPTSNKIFYKLFDLVSAPYWRLKIVGATVAPKITIGYWGELTELDYCTIAFDPNQLTNHDIVNKSIMGYVLGIYETYTERTMSFVWDNTEIYDDLLDWSETIGKQNFFVAWDTEEHGSEVYLMFCEDGKLTAPYSKNGRYRSPRVNLTGRKND